MGECFLYGQGGSGNSGSSINKVTGTITTGSKASSTGKVTVDLGFQPDVIVGWLNPGSITTFALVTSDLASDFSDTKFIGWSGDIATGNVVRGQQIIQVTSSGFTARPVEATYGLNKTLHYEAWKIN